MASGLEVIENEKKNDENSSSSSKIEEGEWEIAGVKASKKPATTNSKQQRNENSNKKRLNSSNSNGKSSKSKPLSLINKSQSSNDKPLTEHLLTPPPTPKQLSESENFKSNL